MIIFFTFVNMQVKKLNLTSKYKYNLHTEKIQPLTIYLIINIKSIIINKKIIDNCINISKMDDNEGNKQIIGYSSKSACHLYSN